jgi:hypothetical protein
VVKVLLDAPDLFIGPLVDFVLIGNSGLAQQDHRSAHVSHLALQFCTVAPLRMVRVVASQAVALDLAHDLHNLGALLGKQREQFRLRWRQLIEMLFDSLRLCHFGGSGIGALASSTSNPWPPSIET